MYSLFLSHQSHSNKIIFENRPHNAVLRGQRQSTLPGEYLSSRFAIQYISFKNFLGLSSLWAILNVWYMSRGTRRLRFLLPHVTKLLFSGMSILFRNVEVRSSFVTPLAFLSLLLNISLGLTAWKLNKGEEIMAWFLAWGWIWDMPFCTLQITWSSLLTMDFCCNSSLLLHFIFLTNKMDFGFKNPEKFLRVWMVNNHGFLTSGLEKPVDLKNMAVLENTGSWTTTAERISYLFYVLLMWISGRLGATF